MSLNTAKFEASYMIYSGSTGYYAKNGTTGKVDYSGSDAGLVIQNAITTLEINPILGGSIYVGDGVYTATEILITASNISIFTNKMRKENTDRPVAVKQLSLIASGGNINNIKLQGLLINKLQFLPRDGYNIAYVTVRDCVFRCTDTYVPSILFSGSNNYPSTCYVMHVTFDNCRMHDYHTTGKGLVRWDYTGSGTAQIYFVNCSYQSQDNDVGPAFYVNGRVHFGLTNFSYEMMYGTATKTGSFLVLGSGSTAYPVSLPNLNITDSLFEIHASGSLGRHVLFNLTGSYNAFGLHWNNNRIMCVDGLTDFVYNNITGYSTLTPADGITIDGGNITNVSKFSTGSMNISANFPVSIKNVRNYTTENNGTLTLTTWSGSTPHGLASTPANVLLTQTGSPGKVYGLGLGWYPSGSTGIWIHQTGSATAQTFGVNWRAEV